LYREDTEQFINLPLVNTLRRKGGVKKVDDDGNDRGKSTKSALGGSNIEAESNKERNREDDGGGAMA